MESEMKHSAERPRPGIDCIGVGVGAVIVDERHRIFLARRGPQARNEKGKWEFPGGAVRYGETQIAALVREIREEFNIEIEVQSLINVADHILPSEGQHWVSPGYICRIRAGTPSIMEPDKCAEFTWVPFKEISRYDLTVASRQTYEGLLQKCPEGP